MRMKTLFTTAAVLMLVTACDGSSTPNRVVGELSSDRIELSARVSESIVEIAFGEGDEVLAGEVLLRQDPARASAVLGEATASVAQAQARLEELVRGPRREQISAARANLDGAKKDLIFRQTEFARARDVHERGLASAETLDRANAALDAAKANVRLREAQLEELLSGTTVEELAQAESALKQAEARHEVARVDVERHIITAPTNGTLDTRLAELGETPSAGEPLLVMLPDDQVYARIFVPEDLRVHVVSGTEATVYVDGLTAPIEGRVRWVSAESAFTPYFALTERDRGRLSYMAKVDLLYTERRLPDGVPVEVEFLLEDR